MDRSSGRNRERRCNSRTVLSKHQLCNCSRSSVGRRFYKSLPALTLRLRFDGLQAQRKRVEGFVGRNLSLMLQGEPDIVQAVQQAVADKFVDREFSAKALIVPHFALLQVDGELITVYLMSSSHNLSGLILGQQYREETILRAVICKDIGKGGGNDRAESEIRKSPDRVLARGTAAEIFPRD